MHVTMHCRVIDQQFGINRRATGATVKRDQMLPDARQIDKTVNGSQQVILRDVIVNRELIKQCTLRFLFWSQHRNHSRFNNEIESVSPALIKKSFSTEFADCDVRGTCDKGLDFGCVASVCGVMANGSGYDFGEGFARLTCQLETAAGWADEGPPAVGTARPDTLIHCFESSLHDAGATLRE